jgi:DNA polymerase-3 subunit alpha
LDRWYKFPCGCTFKVLEDNPPPGVVPLLDFDVELAPENCPATWAMLGEGKTKGVFQLESSLGRTWTRKLKPESMEHMAALGSLLRPGALKAVDEEGISMTQHYARRKNGEEAVASYHPVVDSVLASTYGSICYQEQLMALGRALAGFDLMQVDQLRKAVGKKDQKGLAKVRDLFLDGCKREGVVTDAQAEEIWGWVEKSGRYLFNASHAFCYGVTGYHTAYIKAHFPVAFFAAWLKNAKHKQDPQQEVFELVNDSRLFDIAVEPPDLLTLEPDFHTDRKVVKFGLANIKGVGAAQVAKLRAAVAEAEAALAKPAAKWSWWEFLVHCSGKVSAAVVTRLVQVGALRWTGMLRSQMEAEFRAWDDLTDKEREWVALHAAEFDGLVPALKALAKTKKEGGGCSNKNRVSAVQSAARLLEYPPSPRLDTPLEIANHEEELLGISITCGRIDSCDISAVNTSCRDFLAGKHGFMILGVEVQAVRRVKTKKGASPGSEMAFLTVADQSCSLEDVVCFPETWKEYKHVLTDGNTVIIQAARDFKDPKSSALHVKKVWQATQDLGLSA